MIEIVPSGTVLHGRYRIERVLGSGGFGHVYLAVDITTNLQYAVKEYLVTGSSGEDQLRHEATVLSQLHHPNLAAFQDAFMEGGRYYIVLNYIEGHDLTDLIRMARQRNESIPLTQIMGWILSICNAVMFMHSQRPTFIHRDIKPDNIRITSNGTAVLVDLGNAKAAADGARTLFFIRHQGTPGYAPQEQYPGGSGTDARSDVYALGGTLYFALTGHEPPSVSTRNQALQQRKHDLPTLQEWLANNPPEKASGGNEPKQFKLGVTKPSKPSPRHSRHMAQLGTLSPELLTQLNKIIHRAMAMKPKDRYQYVAEFADELKQVMAVILASSQPSTSESLPLTSNSTQPDLQMVYEAIQAAKGNTSQGSNAPAVQANYCPRCNALIASQATFCSQCGSPLNLGQNRAPNKDITAEQTLLIKPQGQVTTLPHTIQRPSPVMDTPKGQSTHIAAPTSTATRIPPTPSLRRNGPVTDNPLQDQNIGMNDQVPSSSASDLKMIVGIAIVLIILVIIVVLFVISKNHQGHIGMQNLIHWYNLKSQGLSYERIFSRSFTSSFAITAFRVW